MTKNWAKIEGAKYAFSVEKIELGTLEIVLNSTDSKAIAKIGTAEFTIRRTGFWKSGIEIVNQKNEIIAKAYLEKWYSNSMILEFKDSKYKLATRNNPLAEWAIIDGDTDLLAYGLNAGNGTVNLKITTAENNKEYLLDFLLWYIFMPIATENAGDDLTFLLLVG